MKRHAGRDGLARVDEADGRQRPERGRERRRASVANGRPDSSEGHHGWDDYAPFYDWENAQTFGRRDVPFWQRLRRPARGGRVLELGCGTGRVTFPLARTGAATSSASIAPRRCSAAASAACAAPG